MMESARKRVAFRLLTIDRGNTTVDCMLHDHGTRQRFASAPLDVGAFARFVAEYRPQRAILSSVVDRATAIESVLQAAAIPCLLVGRDAACPLPLDYATPTTLGSDRWLGALAAHRRFGRAITIDCGSATTLNFVDVDSTFRGGVIAPGWPAMVVGMQAVTPGLPSPRPDVAGALPGRSSQACVDIGLSLGFAAMVDGLVDAMRKAVGGDPPLVLTGGNSWILLQHTRHRLELVDDLVHQGLVFLEATT